jgi:hypothetical protein
MAWPCHSAGRADVMSSRGRSGPDRIDHLVLGKAAQASALFDHPARRRRDRPVPRRDGHCLFIANDGHAPAGLVTEVDCHGVWVVPTLRTGRRWPPVRPLEQPSSLSSPWMRW